MSEQDKNPVWAGMTLETPDGAPLMVAGPASGLPPDESETELRLLSVSYAYRKRLSLEVDEQAGAEAHVGPEDDPQQTFLLLRSWVRDRVTPSEQEVERLAEQAQEVNLRLRAMQQEVDRLTAIRNQVITVLQRHGVEPSAWAESFPDLPF